MQTATEMDEIIDTTGAELVEHPVYLNKTHASMKKKVRSNTSDGNAVYNKRRSS